METVVAVPVWDHTPKQSAFTQNLVSQMLGSTLGDFHLVVINNNSPREETWQFLNSVNHPRFSVIHLNENRGVGIAYNIGFLFGYADPSCQYFVAMNNDIVLGSPDWLEFLVGPLRAAPYQITGHRYINYNLNVNLDGRVFEYIEGYLMGFSRDGLDEVGLFDEQFSPAYCEDVEICWRAQGHGFELREVSAPITHVYGQTGYISVPDQERIMSTLDKVRKLHAKVNRKDFKRVWASEESCRVAQSAYATFARGMASVSA